MAPKNLHDVGSVEQFQTLLSADLNRVSCLNFWAPWAEPCEAFNKAVAGEAEQFPNQLFLNIEAEQLAEIAESFDIEAVPSFLILRGHTLLARHSGSDTALLHSLLAQHAGAPTSAVTQPSATSSAQPQPPVESAKARTPEEIDARCDQLINKHRCVLFMKGNPSAPKCGFSRQIVGILREQAVEFAWFDIFSDEDVRQALKIKSDWPTFPQLYLNGELVGGLDIFREMVESGEWDELYNEDGQEKLHAGEGEKGQAITA